MPSANLWDAYRAADATLTTAFTHPGDGLVYEVRDPGPTLPTAEEIRQGAPHPAGLGSGIKNCALNSGLRLAALMGALDQFGAGDRVAAEDLPSRVCFKLTCFEDGYYSEFPFDVLIRVDGELRETVTFSRSHEDVEVVLDLGPGDADAKIRIESRQAFVPREVGGGPDERCLSVRFSEFRIEKQTPQDAASHSL